MKRMKDSTRPDKFTKNQALVLGVLSGCGEPLSAYEILERLRDQGIRAPLQIYRALDKLAGFGKIHRLESLNAFIACSHDGQEHTDDAPAFAICERCGRVEEFYDADIATRLLALQRERRFRPVKTTIEIRGFCDACS